MFAYDIHVWSLHSLKEGSRSPRTGVTENCKSRGCLASNLDPMVVQPVLLATEPSLQLPNFLISIVLYDSDPEILHILHLVDFFGVSFHLQQFHLKLSISFVC